MGTDLMPLPGSGESRSSGVSALYGRSAGSRDALVDEFVFVPGRGRSSTSAGYSIAAPSGGGGRGFKGSSRNRLLAAILAAVIVVAAAAFFVMRDGGSADAMVFKYAFNQGAKQTYALSLSVNAVPSGVPDVQSFEGKVDATLGFEVVQTLEDGSSVVDVTLEGLSVTPNPGGFVPPDLGKLTVTLGPDGKVKKVQGSGGVFGAAGAALGSMSSPTGGGDPSETAASQFMFPQFPVNAIAPGDEWSEDATFPLPFGDNTITVHTKAKHEGFEESEFGRVAKLHHAVSSPMNVAFSLADLAGSLGEGGGSALPAGAQNAVFRISGDMSMDADSLVVPETGELVSMIGDGKMSMRMQMEGLPSGAETPADFAMNMTMKVSMTRVSGGVAPAAEAAG
jgi:hypothetical protein